MQPTTPRRAATITSAAAAVAALPIVEFHMANGLVVIKDAAEFVRLLETQQRDRLAAEAEQVALSVCYKLSGEPDPSKPHGGLLTIRLSISQRSAEQLLRDGKLRYVCAGRNKAYRISERAVREFLGDILPT
jgi:hypothetical protein